MSKILNIPIYRAKKVDSDEYVEGYLIGNKNGYFIIGHMTVLPITNKLYSQIDPSTLAINFPDMIDSEGTKIFASLSEDGKGGDVIKGFTPQILDTTINMVNFGNTNFGSLDLNKLRVIGIQE